MSKRITPRSPYVGQRPFERKERHLFFGRENEASSIRRLLTDERGFILMGSAKCGKTSFLNTTLLPLLEAEGIDPLPVAQLNAEPPSQINGVANIYTYTALMGGLMRRSRAAHERATALTFEDALRERVNGKPRALIFDGAEVLFTHHPHRWRDRDDFFRQLERVTKEYPALRLIFLLREDSLANLQDYTVSLGISASFRLRDLRRAAALRAVSLPLEQTPRTITRDAAEMLVDHLLQITAPGENGEVEIVEGEFVSPEALQTTCERLWRSVPAEESVITAEHVRAVFNAPQPPAPQSTDDVLLENRRLAAELDALKTQFEQLKHSSDELTLLKNAIINNVSHELRTPLLHVKSAVALLAEDKTNSTLTEYAMGATARLESAINDIMQLAYSLNINIEAVLVRESIDLAMRNLRRSWANKDKIDRVQIEVEDHLPPILADKQGLGIVIQQLIDNGLKFSQDVVLVTAKRANGCVMVAVKDKGIGIPDDQREKIFDSFYQVDSSSTRRFGGLGVGLAIARLILDRHHIRIHVESKEGHGSTFSFTLPLAPVVIS